MARLRLRDQPLGSVSAVLFDKDGTLSHSEPGLTTLSRARVLACLPLVPRERRAGLQDLLERAYGVIDGRLHPAGTTAVACREHNLISTATAFCQVGLGWPEALAQSEVVFAAIDRDLEREGADLLAPTTDGLEPLLQALDDAGVILGVISNDVVAGIEHFLAGHGLARHIRGIWSAEHRPAKPDPAAVHRFCAELGVDPGSCALIGDANSDLRMARAAGVPLALGYTAGWRTRPTLLEGHPLIHHWSELTVQTEVEEAPGAAITA